MQKDEDYDAFIRFFSREDSVMEFSCVEKMKDFVARYEQPQLVVKLLAENYRGFAQMANLLCNWMQMFGFEEEKLHEIVEDYFRQKLLQHFDPKKADKIFQQASAVPVWLDHMLECPSWRATIYQLAETHKNCLMLNFAIQRISDAGYQAEIASLTTASTYFSVYNKVLERSLESLITMDEIHLQRALPEFKKMCCHSPHTYFYAQNTIQRLIQQTHEIKLKRLSQELQLAVLDKGPVVQAMSLLLSTISNYPLVASSVTGMIAAGSSNPSDIMKLYSCYSQRDNSDSRIPVEFIRHPVFFEILIRELFNPLKPMNSSYKSKYFYILAYAATQCDENEEPNQELDETIKALEVIHPIIQRNSFGSELQANFPILKQYLKYPVVSMGVLYWIRVNVTDADYYISSSHTLCLPIHLKLVRQISLLHPLQRTHILDLLSTMFELKTTGLDALAALDHRKDILDNLIYLMKCGHVIPVMELLEQWSPKTDHYLIRYFFVQIMKAIEPPYSEEFMSSLLRLIGKPSTIDALRALKSSVQSKLVLDFLGKAS